MLGRGTTVSPTSVLECGGGPAVEYTDQGGYNCAYTQGADENVACNVDGGQVTTSSGTWTVTQSNSDPSTCLGEATRSAENCQAVCNAVSGCNCAMVWLDRYCWLRRNCDTANCVADSRLRVYTKNTPEPTPQ